MDGAVGEEAADIEVEEDAEKGTDEERGRLIELLRRILSSFSGLHRLLGSFLNQSDVT